MIRKDTIYWILILVLLGIVVFLTCQSPPPDPSEALYLDSIKELKPQKAFKAAQFDSVSTVANVLVKEKDSLVAALSKEIGGKKVKASKAVEAIPVRVMEENPEIGYALAAKDDVIETQAVLIDTLKSQLAFERNVREQLVALHYDQAKIESQMSELRDQRIISLEKDLKKERRRGRLLKVVAIVGSVAAFIGGSQL